MKQKINPILFSVLLSRLAAIGHEMSITMERTARSSILNESKDFSCSIFNGNGRLITQEEEVLPIHTVAGALVLKEIIKDFKNDINSGDIYICNHPYRNGSHLADLSMACPVFYKDKLVFWTMTRAHHLDIGSPLPSACRADAPDIFSEGLKVPPLRVYKKNKEIYDVVNLYKSNVRYPDMWHDDMRAQVASVRIGEKRLVELCRRYSPELITVYTEEMINYSDRMMSEEIRNMPNGKYYGSAYSDNDGVGNENVLVKCKLTIKDDIIEVDLSESQDQTKGSTNSSWGNTYAQVGTAILSCVNPNIPRNDGCLQHIKVKARKGSVVNPIYPAATSNCTIVIGDTICEVVWKALSQCIPYNTPAGWGKQSGTNLQTSGIDYRNGKPYGYQTFKASSGGGAIWGHDGWNTTLTMTTLGATKCQGVEAEEMTAPHLILLHELWEDSTGPGKWRGGFGSKLVMKGVKHDMTCVFFGDGFKHPPHGILGGMLGRGGYHFVEDKEGKRTYYDCNGMFVLHKDETYYGFASGGGGVGNPKERDIEKVLSDVKDGLISIKSAKKDYGVVIKLSTFEVDCEKTKKNRES